MGDGDKRIEKVYGEEKKVCSWLTKKAKEVQKFLVPAQQAQ
jgi:hypothetical protein